MLKDEKKKEKSNFDYFCICNAIYVYNIHLFREKKQFCFVESRSSSSGSSSIINSNNNNSNNDVSFHYIIIYIIIFYAIACSLQHGWLIHIQFNICFLLFFSVHC